MRSTYDHLTLFNDPRYHALNLAEGEFSVRLDSVADGRLIGSLSAVATPDGLISGHSAPFGGIDLVRPTTLAGEVRHCVAEFIDRLRAKGHRRVAIRCRPDYFGANEPVIAFTLLNFGFRVARGELSLGIPLGSYAGPADYVDALRSSARRALKHGLAMDLAFSACETEAEWRAAFSVLEANRSRRGRQLSIDIDYLLRLRKVFADRTRLYRLVEREGAAIAAALVYQVLPDVDYVVAWGDANHTLDRSPMNLLAFRVVEAALASGRRLVDLGISSVTGVADDGLVQFKRHVGAVPGLRLDLVREFSD